MQVQYKLLYVAGLCLMPLVAHRIDGWIERCRWAAVTGGVAMIAASSAIIFPWVFRDTRVPPLHLDESRFGLEIREDRGWISAVRRRSPNSAVVVAEPTLLPLAVLTQRSLYLSQEPDPHHLIYGYGMWIEQMAVDVKGYSAEEYRRRRKALHDCYGDADADRFAAITAELRKTGRPVLVHFPQGDEPYCQWLRRQSLGRQWHGGGNGIVWMIDGR